MKKLIFYFLLVLTLSSCDGLNVVDAKDERVRSEMKFFSEALGAYKEKNGKYPTTGEGLRVMTRKKEVSDPWGTPYIYISPAPGGGIDTFFLYSAGPNKVDENGQGDDIVCCDFK